MVTFSADKRWRSIGLLLRPLATTVVKVFLILGTIMAPELAYTFEFRGLLLSLIVAC